MCSLPAQYFVLYFILRLWGHTFMYSSSTIFIQGEFMFLHKNGVFSVLWKQMLCNDVVLCYIMFCNTISWIMHKTIFFPIWNHSRSWGYPFKSQPLQSGWSSTLPVYVVEIGILLPSNNDRALTSWFKILPYITSMRIFRFWRLSFWLNID